MEQMSNIDYRNIRVELGYTMKEMATVMNVTDGAISSWEIGRTTPQPPYMEMYKQLRRRLDLYHSQKRKDEFVNDLKIVGVIGLGALLAYLFSNNKT